MQISSALFAILAAVSVLMVGATEAQTEPRHLEHIGLDFFVDMSSLQPGDATVSARVLEQDTMGGKTKASFRAVFNCVTKGTPQVPDQSTPLGRFAAVHTEDPDMYATKKICEAAHVENGETRVARAAAA